MRTFLLLLLIPAMLLAQREIGYVFDFDGEWTLAPRTALNRGDKLPAGGTLRCANPQPGQFIAISGLNGEPLLRRECGKEDCSMPLQLPSTPGRISEMFQALMGMIRSEPDRYSVHRVREGELTDAPVPLTDGTIDLHDALAGREKQKLMVGIRPIGGAWLKPATLDWDPELPAPVSAVDAQPGLYEIAILEREDGRLHPGPLSAWILVCEPSRFRAASQAFAAARKVAALSGGPDAARQYLRAQLEYLATHGPHE